MNFRQTYEVRTRAFISVWILFSAVTASAGPFVRFIGFQQEAVTAVLDCPSLVSNEPFYSGAVERILRRDGITVPRLKNEGIPLSGAEGAVLYTTKRGQRFILKPARTRHEVAASITDRRMKTGLVAQTEALSIDGKPYTAQKFVSDRPSSAPKRKVTTRNGEEIEVESLAGIASNPVPDSLILFDALIGNFDRHKGLSSVKNYLILSPVDEVIDLRNGTYQAPEPHFIAIDHGLAFMPFDLTRWGSMYRIDLPGFKADDLKTILKRHPEFVRNLRQWTPDQIRLELGPLLETIHLNSMLSRREALLKLAR